MKISDETIKMNADNAYKYLADCDNDGNNSGIIDDASSFQIRIKINNGKSTKDLTLSSISPSTMTVGQLKEQILDAHCQQQHQQDEEEQKHYYLRLIVRGKMMAPDSIPLHQFGVVNNDVVHAVLLAMGGNDGNGNKNGSAGRGLVVEDDDDGGGGGERRGGEGRRPIVPVGGGQQARALRRLNNNNNNNNELGRGGVGGGGLIQRGGGGFGGNGGRGGEDGTNSTASTWSSRQSLLWRRIGMDTNDNRNDDSEEDEDDDDNEAPNEVDLEMGINVNNIRLERGVGSRRRRRRGGGERRGFDRLHSTGMSREEVMAIRSYFASSVDRYIERRRAMMRTTSSSRRLRERRGDGIVVTGASGSTNTATGGNQSRQRTSTGESTNSLLDTTEEEDEEVVDRSEGNAQAVGVLVQEGGTDGQTTLTSTIATTNFEGEEIFNDRPRMEDEWMAAQVREFFCIYFSPFHTTSWKLLNNSHFRYIQGPFSEFRMNLNSSNPLLMAAITGGGGFVAANSIRGPFDTTSPFGLFSRSRNLSTGDDDDEMFSGAFTSSGAFVHSNNIGPSVYRPNAGPLPSAGTEKDFVWGFFLGFFVGFIMLFWVWMPSVPHKQKIGIILGISAQLGLNLVRKGGRDDDM